jgi:hypothetical protein
MPAPISYRQHGSTVENGRESFSAYLDESEESSIGVYAVGGFVGKAEVWGELTTKWLDCLPTGITCFHATDCFTGNKQFEGLDIPERVRILDKLTDVILAHEVCLIGYALDAKTYMNLAPRAKQNEFLGNKYAAPFGGAVQLACESMGNPPTPDNIRTILEQGERWQQCAFFIESNEYSASAKRTIANMRNSHDLWFRDRIGTETFGTKSGRDGIPSLQVADLGAFLATKYISQCPEGKISWKPYYEKLNSARRVCRLVRADEYSLNALHQTYEELKQEAAEEARGDGGRSPICFSGS